MSGRDLKSDILFCLLVHVDGGGGGGRGGGLVSRRIISGSLQYLII